MMTQTTTDVRTPKGLLQRVYSLAADEARDARARRGLPFCGLFGTADRATAAGENAPSHDTAH